MKPRRVVVTVELETGWAVANVKDYLRTGNLPTDGVVHQVQVNVVKPGKPKK